ncbi:MAG: restriction endonuclease [Actinobacteria bacterium]|nr:restriction endonuclease [Actinomycetota bacterium]
MVELPPQISTWLHRNPSLAIFIFGTATFLIGIGVGASAGAVTWLGMFIALMGVAGLMGNKRVSEENRIRRSNVGVIDSMAGHEFERTLVTLFEMMGYEVIHNGRRGDLGADLIVSRDGVKTVIQAKRWTGTIGPGAIQEVTAARAHYEAHHAIVVTNSTYTPSAKILAESNQIELWDRSDLIREISVLSFEPPLLGMLLLRRQLRIGVPRLGKKVLIGFLVIISTGSNSKRRRRRKPMFRVGIF